MDFDPATYLDPDPDSGNTDPKHCFVHEEQECYLANLTEGVDFLKTNFVIINLGLYPDLIFIQQD
jgi:hypothetical protein